MEGPQFQRGSSIPRRMVATMSNNEIEIDSERFRIRAALVNSGRYTFAGAEKKLAASKLSIILGATAARTPAGQAAFLTAIITSTRCFGEVNVESLLWIAARRLAAEGHNVLLR